jgi:GntR family transcriptional regulator, transcriptional repressor for pyruvate dehydrogenase complex
MNDIGLVQTDIQNKTSKEVFLRLQEAIVEGTLEPGSRLPSERRLAEMLNISRTSVREGLRVLDAMGLIEARTGSGKRAGTFILERPGSALSDLLRLNVALMHFTLDEVANLRVSLEVAALGSASQQPNDKLIDELGSLVTKMEHETSRASFADLDAEFHLKLSQLSENRLTSYLINVCHGLILEQMRRGFNNVRDWTVTRKKFAREHCAILDAVKIGDIVAAISLIKAHLDDPYH